ncbi:MAG: HAMP domain-containing histidine kinase, partial [Elusimicrobia bacterium]|nr:HAMP domain-containing histidine kinase [Elusimicrobiota bacterium]
MTSYRLSAQLSGAQDRALFGNLDRQLAAYMVEQQQWIGLRTAGGLPSAQTRQLTRRRGGIDKLVKTLIAVKNENIAKLESRRAAVDRASRVVLCLILATGVLVALALLYFLTHYLVEPLQSLQVYAGTWKLGEEWALNRPPESPEMADLFGTLRRLMEQLNRQYAREHELAQFKTKLVSMVSHEFNNALSVIQGITSLLQDSEPSGAGDDKRAKYYALLGSQVRALIVAATNLLNLGRMESGQFAVKRRPVDLGPMIKDVAERLSLLGERKKIRIKVLLPPAPVPVQADAEVLSLVVTNLVSNAIKYTPEGGDIAVGLERLPDGRDVRVYVRDTGIGISKEDQERVFAAYYRTESGKREAQGFGVGLSLARAAVEAHESVLRLESAPGQGSTFFFILAAA